MNIDIQKIGEIGNISQGAQEWDSQLQLLLDGVVPNKKKDPNQQEKSPGINMDKLKSDMPQSVTSQIQDELGEIDKELEELERMMN